MATAETIAGSAGFVGSSLHGAVTATAFGLPAAIINTDSRSKLEGFAETVGLRELIAHDAAELDERLGPALERQPGQSTLVALHAELDAHFDRLAAVALG
jgi:polysaccharide pyruvyl transferase WcaK-like protein